MLKFPHTAGSSAPPAQHILTQYVCVFYVKETGIIMTVTV